MSDSPSALRLEWAHWTLGLVTDVEASSRQRPILVRRNASDEVLLPEYRRGSTNLPAESPMCFATSESHRGARVWAAFGVEPGYQLGGRYRAHAEFQWIARVGGRDDWPYLRVVGLPSAESAEFAVATSRNTPIALDFDSRWGEWMSEAGVGVYDTVIKWSLCGQAGRVDLGATSHRIYVVLDRPRAPFVDFNGEGDTHSVPWTEALDYACTWASGANTAPAVRAGVVRGLYMCSPGLLRYNASKSVFHDTEFPNSGARHYLKLGALLERLRAPRSTPPAISCTSVALTVRVMTALLGVDVCTTGVVFTGSRENCEVLPLDWAGFQADLGGLDFHEFCVEGKMDAEPHEPTRRVAAAVEGLHYDASYTFSGGVPCAAASGPPVFADGVSKAVHYERLVLDVACGDIRPAALIESDTSNNFAGLLSKGTRVVRTWEELFAVDLESLGLPPWAVATLETLGSSAADPAPAWKDYLLGLSRALADEPVLLPSVLETHDFGRVARIHLHLVGASDPLPGWSFDPNECVATVSVHIRIPGGEFERTIADELFSQYPAAKPSLVASDTAPTVYVAPDSSEVLVERAPSRVGGYLVGIKLWKASFSAAELEALIETLRVERSGH